MSILKILHSLNSTASSNEKTSILLSYSDNLLLKEVCRLTYNPQIRFFIKKRPESITIGTKPLEESLKALVEIIANRVKTGNAAIEFVQDLLNDSSLNDQEVIYRILERDLKCGTGTSIINKVWKKLIPDYPILLCNKFNLKTESKIKYPAILQCLSEDWVVNTNKGDFTIKELVESNDEYLIKCYNHSTSNITYSRMINKFVNIKFTQKWYILTLEDGTKTKPITGNHLVWCINKNQYIQVDNLSPNDSILVL